MRAYLLRASRKCDEYPYGIEAEHLRCSAEVTHACTRCGSAALLGPLHRPGMRNTDARGQMSNTKSPRRGQNYRSGQRITEDSRQTSNRSKTVRAIVPTSLSNTTGEVASMQLSNYCVVRELRQRCIPSFLTSPRCVRGIPNHFLHGDDACRFEMYVCLDTKLEL